jgi:hypothetical protein
MKESPEVDCGITNRGPEHGRGIQKPDSPEISCGIQELSGRKTVVVGFTNQIIESCRIHEREPWGWSWNSWTEALDSLWNWRTWPPSWNSRTVANRDWSWNPRTKALTLVVEFANPKDLLWNLRTEADRDLLWNSRTYKSFFCKILCASCTVNTRRGLTRSVVWDRG